MPGALHTVGSLCASLWARFIYLFSCGVNSWTRGFTYARRVLPHWAVPALRRLLLAPWSNPLSWLGSPRWFLKSNPSNKTMSMSLTASKISVSVFGAPSGALSFSMLGKGTAAEQPSWPPCLKAFDGGWHCSLGNKVPDYPEWGRQSGGPCLPSEERVRPNWSSQESRWPLRPPRGSREHRAAWKWGMRAPGSLWWDGVLI